MCIRDSTQLEARVAEAVPDARLTRDGDSVTVTVTVTGRGVIAALPWPGGLLR